MVDFKNAFHALTGNAPFPWQADLYENWFSQGKFPASCNLPTGLGKTNVLAVWLVALANHPDVVPRRLVYVVNRRTVVDQTTDVAEEMQEKAEAAGVPKPAISTLRGQFADNREWSADPSRPAIICGTVDMIGSRLLFSGYGLGFKSRPLHAGFLGQDVLLVHDEAHLEPAFQKLLTEIEAEQQRCNEFGRFRVVELSATSRGTGEPFTLTPDDFTNDLVQKRVGAKKAITLHRNADPKKLADELAALALKRTGAVLVFVRKVEDVDLVCKKLPKGQFEKLTGTLRGKERDELVEKDAFKRFLPGSAASDETVFLVCTSAGEVGVNISADHLVCDLSTFDSMAQRFGRVNRFGLRDALVDVVHPTEWPTPKEVADERKKEKPKQNVQVFVDDARHRTHELLLKLDGNASPEALGRLDPDDRQAAFAPTPELLTTSRSVFDSWALTSVRGKLPGRPAVEPYLHGVHGWQPPETVVAWRSEVGLIAGDLLGEYAPSDLLEDYPLKPHETLREPSLKAAGKLEKLAKRRPDTPAWLVDDDGTVKVITLSDLSDKDLIARKTVLLPPAAGGLDATGMLDGDADQADDVADHWYADEAKTQPRRLRERTADHRPKRVAGMRRVRTVDLKPEADDSDATTEGGRYWHWYEAIRGGDGDGSKASQKPVTLAVHVADVVGHAETIVARLPLDPEVREAVTLAAHYHDLGKDRQQFQAVLGNPRCVQPLLAKSGKKGGRVREAYRHEYGSLVDVLAGRSPDRHRWDALSDDMRELALHLIAAHHGRGRPHFPADKKEAIDPSHPDTAAVAAEVPRRFARLQRRYGRWGLAYLESLLRAADYAASGNPSEYLSEDAE